MKVDLSRARWRKASASVGMSNCVEVADLGAQLAVRDSKDRQGPKLVFGSGAWSSFVGGAKKGEFDLR
ncbi:protein of unknown function [Actinopolymorpha cephalotaxi]|uniref:DUF397 domain-containing protein n=1 Tax=Actinopolymorpha cephalotaxi TaxID=504797 RepID=A0A1I2M0I0_9ACTN|nr:DUF397 domain-containing protein [Actinopolymorpha cephalotaxi]NYH81505.1 hypothetical protein [Actinopolymorpha cephalotaxi]SFF84320.1 protein of unknown function [Actinopolymorpha cephalotaxi]